MSRRRGQGPIDYQKREAKRSLWDMDGIHIDKKLRCKGGPRNQEKAEIRKELAQLEVEPQEALNDMLNEEADENSYCHFHGPCRRCKENES